MSILLVIGNNGPIKQSHQKSWSYPTGEGVAEIYKGVYSYVENLYSTYKAVAAFAPNIDSLQLVYERGMGTLTVQTVEDGPIQYELVSNLVSLPIFGHPVFVTGGAYVLTDSERHAVRVSFELGINKNPDQNLAYPFDGSAFSASQQKLYGFLSSGVEEYNTSAYVLRQSQTVSKRSTVTASFDNVNRVDTPPNTSATNTLIGSLPTGEWLKQSPNVRMFGNRKWQISQEWWWAPKWSTILYGGTGTP